jgi:hypothetical protein
VYQVFVLGAEKEPLVVTVSGSSGIEPGRQQYSYCESILQTIAADTYNNEKAKIVSMTMNITFSSRRSIHCGLCYGWHVHRLTLSRYI